MDTDTPKPHILVVDDESDMVALLQDLLRRAGFEADGASNGEEARRALAARAYELMLLDLRLKSEDGLTLARQLRQGSPIPIIMISGSSDETDRVLLLELAADDFLVKPFSPRELVARVRAVLRRYGNAPAAPAAAPALAPAAGPWCGKGLRFGDWVLDTDERELRLNDGTLCPLTQAEYRLLEAFVEQPHRIWTRDQLLERTRSLETEVFDRTIDVLILRLRRKIEPNPKHPQFICTERGLGYVFAADVTRHPG
ncbi:response regulator transcription factor [Aquincola sp. S2]|uniref:Response regulator transcription factor n=1 Tax=Pseudaquabacterium terrae TaxID=2732868 RepID=A0ABX2ETS2_9BURK|nr:response regulator transcription factor [Aquabacterium terrae]NRF72152.1 response regulator transcription factor [Aquabacterium terrae]